jgi:hypothetical protein
MIRSTITLVHPGTDYWVAVATVMPVLALALVIEARGLAVRATSKHGPGGALIQALMSVTWFTPMALFVFGEFAALRALRGENVASWWPAFCELAIGIAMSLLVLMPAAQLLSWGALSAVFMYSLQPRTRLKLWWAVRRLTHGKRFQHRQLAAMRVRLAQQRQECVDIQADIDALEPDADPERITHALAKLHEIMASIASVETEIEAQAQQFELDRQRITIKTDDLRQKMRDARAKARAAWQRDVLGLADLEVDAGGDDM